MSKEREKVYQILELGKHIKNLHHKKGFGGLLFIDLSMIKFSKLSSYIRQLDKENQELKKQVENCYCNRTDCSSRIKDSKKYDSLVQVQETQQKEFIKYLEEEIQQQEIVIAENQEKSYFLIYEDDKDDLKLSSQKAYIKRIILEEILQKYKEIIGVSND